MNIFFDSVLCCSCSACIFCMWLEDNIASKKYKLIYYIICLLLKTMSVDADGWAQTFSHDVLMRYPRCCHPTVPRQCIEYSTETWSMVCENVKNVYCIYSYSYILQLIRTPAVLATCTILLYLGTWIMKCWLRERTPMVIAIAIFVVDTFVLPLRGNYKS